MSLLLSLNTPSPTLFYLWPLAPAGQQHCYGNVVEVLLMIHILGMAKLLRWMPFLTQPFPLIQAWDWHDGCADSGLWLLMAGFVAFFLASASTISGLLTFLLYILLQK